MGNIGMNKGGLLAWNLYNKDVVVNCVVVPRSCVDLGDYVGVGV